MLPRGRRLALAALQERGIQAAYRERDRQQGHRRFRTAFERWVAADGDRELTELVRESLEALRTIAATA